MKLFFILLTRHNIQSTKCKHICIDYANVPHIHTHHKSVRFSSDVICKNVHGMARNYWGRECSLLLKGVEKWSKHVHVRVPKVEILLSYRNYVWLISRMRILIHTAWRTVSVHAQYNAKNPNHMSWSVWMLGIRCLLKCLLLPYDF